MEPPGPGGALDGGRLTAARPGGPHTPPPANRTTGPIGRALPDRTAPTRSGHTGPQSAITSTGPHAAVGNTTGPQAAVSGTGPHAAVGNTGPRPAVDRPLAPAAPGGR